MVYKAYKYHHHHHYYYHLHYHDHRLELIAASDLHFGKTLSKIVTLGRCECERVPVVIQYGIGIGIWT